MKETDSTAKKCIGEVVKARVCCGCGVCSAACPTGAIAIRFGERFNFPIIEHAKCSECGTCLKVCPSEFLLHGTDPGFDAGTSGEFRCYLSHATDDKVRHDAASGGFISQLILSMLKSGQATGAVVARCQGDNPLVADSFIARTRDDVLSARGSKYAPVSNCCALRDVLTTPGRYVFVGTPCMIEGLTKLETVRPFLRERIVLTIGLVCAGMASRLSTRRYVEDNGGVNMRDAYRIQYRGAGWPGRFRVFDREGNMIMDRPLIGGSLTHVVGVDHYLRCENCLDHWGRHADLVVSDPWKPEMVQNEKEGWSAVMVRTRRGQEAIDAVKDDTCLVYKPIERDEFLAYNKHLFVDQSHSRHGWMVLYQIVFNRRWRYLWPVLRLALRMRLVGARTTIAARIARRYYY